MKNHKGDVVPQLTCLAGTSAGPHTATTLLALKQFLAQINMAQQE